MSKTWLRKRNEAQHNKANKITCVTAKTQISPGFSESLLYALWVAKDLNLLQTDSRLYQTKQMLRLIGVIAGHTGHFVDFVMLWLKYVGFTHDLLHFHVRKD